MSNDSFYNILTKLEGQNCNLFEFLSPLEHNCSEHISWCKENKHTECFNWFQIKFDRPPNTICASRWSCRFWFRQNLHFHTRYSFVFNVDFTRRGYGGICAALCCLRLTLNSQSESLSDYFTAWNTRRVGGQRCVIPTWFSLFPVLLQHRVLMNERLSYLPSI